MPHTLLFSAVLVSATVAAMAVRAEDAAATPDTIRAGVQVADAVAGGQTSADAIVAPVKRVAPRTPVFTYGAVGGAGAAGGKKPQPIVPARPNCDPGFKVDDAGSACVPNASGTTKAPRTQHKTSARKKKR